MFIALWDWSVLSSVCFCKKKEFTAHIWIEKTFIHTMSLDPWPNKLTCSEKTMHWPLGEGILTFYFNPHKFTFQVPTKSGVTTTTGDQWDLFYSKADLLKPLAQQTLHILEVFTSKRVLVMESPLLVLFGCHRSSIWGFFLIWPELALIYRVPIDFQIRCLKDVWKRRHQNFDCVPVLNGQKTSRKCNVFREVSSVC